MHQWPEREDSLRPFYARVRCADEAIGSRQQTNHATTTSAGEETSWRVCIASLKARAENSFVPLAIEASSALEQQVSALV